MWRRAATPSTASRSVAYNEERMASTIIEANPDLSDVLIFEGGEAVRIPIVETVETPETLPPWRR